ncbi:MAG: hypothetical protein KIT33_08335 [Candidatus Kapabacteria bacterium]|nr:hypothetical protein [Ignavibacteriota bacterium]MCW5884962.1 hypothetical protein [Candidatus Kapabacteria bacterium]
MNQENKKSEIEFTQTIDFYWRAIAVYGVILIVYSLAFGTIEEGRFEINATNPIVLLLIIIIIGTTISLLYRLSRKRAIVIGEDFIIFKSRFREKIYKLNDIKQIIFAKERIFRTRRKYSVIKLKVNQRKLMLRIRPSAFDNEILMVKMLQSLAKKIN